MGQVSDVLHGLVKRQLGVLGNLLGFNNGFSGNSGNGNSGSSSSGGDDSSNDDPSTVVSVVYVTMTSDANKQTQSIAPITSQDKTTQVQTTQAKQTSANTLGQPMIQTAQQTSQTSQTTKATNTIATTDRNNKPTATSGTSTQGTDLASSKTQASAQSATQTTSATSVPTSSSQGMSGGAKAGIAFAIILAFALVGGIIFFVIRRKKQQKDQESHNLDNEKTFFAAASPSKSINNDPNTRAPRLSLRPVTQFLPAIGEPKVTEMATATGGLVPSYWGPGPTHASGPVQSRPSTSNSYDSANPFGQNAERLDPAAAEKAALNAPIPVPAMTARSGPSDPPSVPTGDPFADKQSEGRSISPEVTPSNPVSGSPPKSGIETAAAVTVPPPASTSPKAQSNNVHRVQLDFKPSMDDEIELRAGDVIRVLHEYDDGWALCMRMDRSKQGVAPRTCLSKLPIKPRPAGPPPGMRPVGRPQSPGMRNFSGPPSHGPSNMFPAPLSPSLPNMRTNGGPQDQSPQGRMRSHSTTHSLDNGRQGGSPQLHSAAFPSRSPQRDHRRSASMGQLALDSPTRPIPLRKPVPGQAI